MDLIPVDGRSLCLVGNDYIVQRWCLVESIVFDISLEPVLAIQITQVVSTAESTIRVAKPPGCLIIAFKRGQHFSFIFLFIFIELL